MAVPYTFAGATSSIPLSQLDTNFASTITLGNTAIQLGNTVTTLNNMTLANVTISSGNVTITNVTVTTANVTVGNITTLTGTSATYTNIASGNVTITGGTLNNVAIGGTTAASGAFTTLSASGAFSLTGDQVQISEGGTGQTTANAAFNALAPSQTGNSGKYLKTDGTDTSWDAIDINTADITGTLPILNGGTGQTTANAAFNALAPSQTSQSGKYLKTDGTNASWDALDISTADITGTLPIANGGTGLTALGTGVQTALGQNVTGSGGIVLATSPVLTTPNLGTPSAATLTNATGLPISTGVSGLGTNVATALAVNVGTAGAFVVNGGALGTPSGGTLTNCTGYPTSALSGSINLATQVTGTLATTNGGTGLTSFTANGVVYASSTSALTTGSALTFDGTSLSVAIVKRDVDNSFVTLLGGTSSATSAAVYATGPSYAAASTIYIDSAETVFRSLNGVSSRMTLTSTGLGIGTSSPAVRLDVAGRAQFTNSGFNYVLVDSTSSDSYLRLAAGGTVKWYLRNNIINSNALEITPDAGSSTGLFLTQAGNLGIGTSSPTDILTLAGGASGSYGLTINNAKEGGGTKAIFQFDRDNGLAVVGANTTNGLVFKTLTSGSLTTKATLDSSGNLGLGVTPSAGTSGKVFQITNAGHFMASGPTVYIDANAYFDSGWKYITTAAASNYYQNSGAHIWQTAPSGTAGDPISFTTAMTLDASGNLGVGTTSPVANFRLTTSLSYDGSGGLYVENTSTGTSASSITRYKNSGATFAYTGIGGASRASYAGLGANVLAMYTDSTAGIALTVDAAGPITFNTNATERARITSGGYFKASFDGTYNDATGQFHEFVGNVANGYTVRTKCANASPANHYIGEFIFSAASPNSTGALFIECRDSTAARFELRSNGGLANYSANDVNLSDRREKTNFAPATSYLDKICSIPVQTFNYIDQSEDDPGLTLGVVAQDVQAVAPELVMESNWGSKDDPKMRLSIYQTDLQYALMKCIQELKAQNDDLRARVAQLEAK